MWVRRTSRRTYSLCPDLSPRSSPDDVRPRHAYAGRGRDLANVGQGNLIWSELLKPALEARASVYEVSYAVTPLVVFLALAGAGLAAWLLLAGRQARLSVARLAVALTGTAVITAILPLDTRSGSAWATVWHLPGASALRAIDRIRLVTGMLAILAIAAAASEGWVAVTAASRQARLARVGPGPFTRAA